MNSKRHFSALALLLGLLALSSAASAFPFWLAGPDKRDNPHDPQVATATPSGPTNTFTITNTPTATNTPGGPTNTPTLTNTPGGATNTPTPTPTATLTNTPGGATNTPTQTPTVCAGMLADFESNDGNNNYGQGISTVKDSYGSTISPDGAFAAGVGYVAPGSGNTSNYAARISGTEFISAAPNYPYTILSLPLAASGVVDMSAYQGLQFKYKAGALGFSFDVIVQISTVPGGDDYRYRITPTNTGWNTVSVYFPGVNTCTLLAQPSYSTPVSWDATKVQAVQFSIASSTSANVPFDLYVDDVTFCAPTPPSPPALPTTPHQIIMDWEGASGGLNQTTANPPFNGWIYMSIDSYGTTMNIEAGGSNIAIPSGGGSTDPGWGATPGSTFGGGSSFAGRIFGDVWPEAAPTYPYAEVQMPVSTGSTSPIDIHTFCSGDCVPNKRLMFDYKANTLGASYRIRVLTSDVTDYAYWGYTFTPTDTNWHRVAVYFPDACYSPQMDRPTWAYAPVYGTAFDPTKVWAVAFSVVPGASAVTYDINIDNIGFD